MAYTFNEKPVATIKAKVAGTAETLSVAGTNPTSTPANAKAQIDKVLAIVGGGSLAVEGMSRVRVAEVIDNG